MMLPLTFAIITVATLSAQPPAATTSTQTAPAAPAVESTPAAPKEPEPTTPLPEGATLYHTLTGRDAQVIFTSDAPLEKIIGKSNAVAGFAVPGIRDNPANLAQAKWVLPVRSLATGIPLRDQHLAGKDWLDADAATNIQFVLSRVTDIKEVKRGDGFSTWSATLVGEMSIHATVHEVTVKDARLTFFQGSAKTKSIAPGDLFFLKCDYTVKLSDFGIHNADVPSKVSDTVTIAQTLRLSNAPPETIKASQKEATKPATGQEDGKPKPPSTTAPPAQGTP
jgi:polyisoprenoid-binding protein YceI